MGRKSFLIRALKIIPLIISFVFFEQVPAAEFSADMTETQGDKIKKSKINVRGENYSLEVNEDGEKLLVLVDMKSKQTTVVVFSAREYRVIPSDHMMSLMNDPFQGYIYTAEMGEEKAAGSETVSGYECDKYVVIMQDTEVMTKWVARKLNFPIKIVSSQGGPIMELANIVEGPAADDRFKIPEGFTRWIDPETLPVPIPDWAANLDAAPVLNPPFERVMNAGDIVRIKSIPGKSLKVKAADKEETELESKTEARVIPFKDGRPLKEEMNYYNLIGTSFSVRHETPAAADEFVVFVYKGNINAVAKWQEMTEQDVAAGGEFRYKVVGEDNIEVYMVNIGKGEAVAIFEFYKTGVPLSEEECGPVKWRTTELKEPGESKKTALSAKGDEVVVKVEKGEMQIKIGQYDSFEF